MEFLLQPLCPAMLLSLPLLAAEGRKGYHLLMELTCSWGDAQAPRAHLSDMAVARRTRISPAAAGTLPHTSWEPR